MPVLEHLAQLSDERFLAIYESLSERGVGPLDRQVAADLKFRPQAVVKLPLVKRAKRARMLIERGKNAELLYEFFGMYLMRNKKDLVLGFLDGTGVEHEDGIIQAHDAAPAAVKLPETLEKLEAEHGADDVALYLALAAEQWPDEDAVQKAWRERIRQPAGG